MFTLRQVSIQKVKIKFNTGKFFYRERAWVGVYTSIEIEYALTLGYVLVNVYECYHYNHKDAILAPYMKALSHFKLKYSSYDNQKDENFMQQLDNLNSKMNFKDTELELKPNTLQHDSCLREHFKMLLNSSLGKFSQKQQTFNSVFINSQVRTIVFIVQCLFTRSAFRRTWNIYLNTKILWI